MIDPDGMAARYNQATGNYEDGGNVVSFQDALDSYGIQQKGSQNNCCPQPQAKADATGSPQNNVTPQIGTEGMKLSNNKDIIEEPGTLEGMVPIWGSGKQAVHDFQVGNYGWATFNGAMAISDVFLLKSIATASAKGMWKLGSHTWNATRKWMLKAGYTEANQPLHHWAISQKAAKKNGIEWLANQPWNMKLFATQSMHLRAGHGMSYLRQPGYGIFGQIWYGTPIWPKATAGSYGGRVIQELTR